MFWMGPSLTVEHPVQLLTLYEGELRQLRAHELTMMSQSLMLDDFLDPAVQLFLIDLKDLMHD